MRYSKAHTEAVKQRLVAAGGRLIKKRGVLGAGVDRVARSLGLSGAALYSHFSSKQELLCAVLREELGASARRFFDGNATWEEALERYLSLAHVRNPDAGCVLPAITPDVARADPKVRRAFEAGLAEVVQAFAEKTGRQAEALGLISTAMGAVALARALPDDARAEQVLASARAVVKAAILGKERPPSRKRRRPPRR